MNRLKTISVIPVARSDLVGGGISSLLGLVLGFLDSGDPVRLGLQSLIVNHVLEELDVAQGVVGEVARHKHASEEGNGDHKDGDGVVVVPFSIIDSELKASPPVHAHEGVEADEGGGDAEVVLPVVLVNALVVGLVHLEVAIAVFGLARHLGDLAGGRLSTHSNIIIHFK